MNPVRQSPNQEKQPMAPQRREGRGDRWPKNLCALPASAVNHISRKSGSVPAFGILLRRDACARDGKSQIRLRRSSPRACLFLGSRQPRRAPDESWQGPVLAVCGASRLLLSLDFCQIVFKLFFVRESRGKIRFDSSPFASFRQALFRRQKVFQNICYGGPGPVLHP